MTDSGTVVFERLLFWPRATAGVLLAVVVPAVSDAPLSVVAAAGAGLVVVAAVSRLLGRHRPTGRWWPTATGVADLVIALSLVIGLAPYESMPAVLLLPLVAAELTLKHGPVGAGLGLAALGLGLAGRSAARVAQFDSPPRIWLIVAMVVLTGLLIALAGAVRSAERRRHDAESDRERLAQILRTSVEAVVGPDGAGGGVDHAERHRDLRELVELACSRPALGSELAHRLADAVAPRRHTPPLSDREIEVLRLLGTGLRDREVARKLFLSPGTVRVHVSHAVHKLGVADRAAAIEWARELDGGRRPDAGEADPVPG